MAKERHCTHDDDPSRKEGQIEMTITTQNIHAHELVGLDAKIIDSSDPTLNGLDGIIVFETKNTISIRANSAIKRIAKRTAKKIEVHTESGVCFISGSSMIGRPEDRISRLN